MLLRGVILAVGEGGNLYPLNTVINRYLLPVGKLPMINYAINKLVSVGIKDIAVVLSTEHVGAMVDYLGSGKAFGCSFTFFIYDGIGGIIQALCLTRDFCYASDRFVVLLGDNLFEDALSPYVDDLIKQKACARIFLKNIADPQRFCVAEFDGSSKLIGLESYPTFPKSSFAVTGLYMYEPAVFKLIESLYPATQEKLNFAHVNKEYLKRGELSHAVFNGWWTDAGTHIAYSRVQLLIASPPK
jgi:glucose-1-phosphate thymidylyltransferase